MYVTKKNIFLLNQENWNKTRRAVPKDEQLFGFAPVLAYTLLSKSFDGQSYFDLTYNQFFWYRLIFLQHWLRFLWRRFSISLG